MLSKHFMYWSHSCCIVLTSPPTFFNRPTFTPFDLEEAMYGIELPDVGQPFCFKVVRKQKASRDSSSSGPVFDGCGLSLVFKDQFLELATHVPTSASLYGLGERF